ncbi:MAG: hypothetical protein AB7E63_05895 [Parachlamydia sp.]
MTQILDDQRYQIRYTWHMGISINKVATHSGNASKIVTIFRLTFQKMGILLGEMLYVFLETSLIQTFKIS